MLLAMYVWLPGIARTMPPRPPGALGFTDATSNCSVCAGSEIAAAANIAKRAVVMERV